MAQLSPNDKQHRCQFDRTLIATNWDIDESLLYLNFGHDILESVRFLKALRRISEICDYTESLKILRSVNLQRRSVSDPKKHRGLDRSRAWTPADANITLKQLETRAASRTHIEETDANMSGTSEDLSSSPLPVTTEQTEKEGTMSSIIMPREIQIASRTHLQKTHTTMSGTSQDPSSRDLSANITLNETATAMTSKFVLPGIEAVENWFPSSVAINRAREQMLKSKQNLPLEQTIPFAEKPSTGEIARTADTPLTAETPPIEEPLPTGETSLTWKTKANEEAQATGKTQASKEAQTVRDTTSSVEMLHTEAISPTGKTSPNTETSRIGKTKSNETTQPTGETQLNGETQLTGETQATGEAQPIAETQPTGEAQPIAKTRPTTETQPAAETQPTAEIQPIAATHPTDETQVTGGSKPSKDTSPDEKTGRLQSNSLKRKASDGGVGRQETQPTGKTISSEGSSSESETRRLQAGRFVKQPRYQHNNAQRPMLLDQDKHINMEAITPSSKQILDPSESEQVISKHYISALEEHSEVASGQSHRQNTKNSYAFSSPSRMESVRRNQKARVPQLVPLAVQQFVSRALNEGRIFDNSLVRENRGQEDELSDCGGDTSFTSCSYDTTRSEPEDVAIGRRSLHIIPSFRSPDIVGCPGQSAINPIHIDPALDSHTITAAFGPLGSTSHSPSISLQQNMSSPSAGDLSRDDIHRKGILMRSNTILRMDECETISVLKPKASDGLLGVAKRGSEINSVPPAEILKAYQSLEPEQWLTDLALQLVVKTYESPAFIVLDPLWIRPVGQKQSAMRLQDEICLIVPFHQDDHWAVAAIDIRGRCINFYNSLESARATNDARLRLTAFCEAMTDKRRNQDSPQISRQPWTFNIMECAKQSNLNDCGVYTIVNVLYLLSGKPVPEVIDTVMWRSIFRAIIAAHLVNGDIAQFSSSLEPFYRASPPTQTAARTPDANLDNAIPIITWRTRTVSQRLHHTREINILAQSVCSTMEMLTVQTAELHTQRTKHVEATIVDLVYQKNESTQAIEKSSFLSPDHRRVVTIVYQSVIDEAISKITALEEEKRSKLLRATAMRAAQQQAQLIRERVEVDFQTVLIEIKELRRTLEGSLQVLDDIV